MDLPTDELRGLNLTVYAAEPGSATHDGITLLANWAATAAHLDRPLTHTRENA